MLIREHARDVGTRAHEHMSTRGTLGREHMSTQSTLSGDHVSTQGTLAREQVSTQCTLSREHVFSTQGTQFSRLKKYSNSSRLLFTNTDSLIHEIKIGDVYEDFGKCKEMFGFSNYSFKSKYYDDANKLVVGKM